MARSGSQLSKHSRVCSVHRLVVVSRGLMHVE